MTPRLRSLSAFTATLALACGSNEASAPSDAGSAPDEDPPCRRDVAYAATDALSCESVPGLNGTWSPLPGSEAGATRGKRQCEFTWIATGGAPPDLPSLDQAPALSGVVDGCAQAISFDLDLTTTPPDDSNIGGTLGCDVCGVQRDRRVQLVIPPDENELKRLDIPVQYDGPERKWVSFALASPLSPGSYRVHLPAAPQGRPYAPGYVRLRPMMAMP